MGVGNLGYLVSIVPGVLAIVGNLRGGPWVSSGTWFIVAICVADWFVRDSRRDRPDRNSFVPDLILILNSIVNVVAIGTLLYGAASGRLPRWRIGEATLSTGLNSGISGIAVAHELIHRRARAWRALGIWNLIVVNYAHFYIEHMKGHHRLVGTRADASTARPGESVYHFLLRSMPAQFLCALRIEAARLTRRGQFPFGPANFVVATAVAQAAIVLAIGAGLGPAALKAYVYQGLYAVLMLQVVSYLQHSGLERPEGSRIASAHSWQSDRISSRLLLLELPRHADHHGHASKPYHTLASHDDSPTLPLGLMGTVPLVLIPPLWFAVARRSLGMQSRSRVPAPRLIFRRGTRREGVQSQGLRSPR